MSEDGHLPPEIWCVRRGLVPYARRACAMQKELEADRQAGRVPDVLLLLEHPPVYTRGRRSEPGELPMGEEWYRAQGIDIVETDRGGRITYHGPGPAGRLPDHEPQAVPRRRRSSTSAAWSPRSSRRSPTSGIDGRPDRGADRRVDARAAQDRVDRRAREPRRHHARLRDQRQQRPPAVRVDRALRHRQLPHDLRREGAPRASSTWSASWTSCSREFGVAYGAPADPRWHELIVAAEAA